MRALADVSRSLGPLAMPQQWEEKASARLIVMRTQVEIYFYSASARSCVVGVGKDPATVYAPHSFSLYGTQVIAHFVC
jgi:hypothetical protein